MKKKYIIMLLCASLSLTGCLSSMLKPEKDPTVFYVLKENPAVAKSDAVLNMNMSSVTLPAYMTKAQIVSFASDNTLFVSEFNRWGETLNTAVGRVVYMNIMDSVSPQSKIYAYPISVYDSKLPTLNIAIFEFGGTVGGESKIKAMWSYIDASGKVLAEEIFEKKISSNKGYSGYVDSLSTLLADLSADISTKISNK